MAGASTEPLPPHWAFKLAVWLTTLVDWFRDLITPTPIRILEKGMAFMGSGCISACCKLDIYDAVQPGWNSLDALVTRTGLDRETLGRLLKASHQYGFLELKGSTERFEVRHNRFSQGLVGNDTGSLKPFLIHQYIDSMPAYGRLHEIAKTGNDPNAKTAFEAAHGLKFWDYVKHFPDRLTNFSQAMRAVDTVGVPAVLADHDWAGYSRILDIGGATGSFLSEILDKTQSKGVVCDLEQVIEDAKASWKVRKANGDDLARTALPNMDFKAIDFMKKGTLPEGKDGDCYLFRLIFHDHTDKQSLEIMKNARYAIGKSKAKMVIVEMSPVELTPSPLRLVQHFSDLLMMVLFYGKERTKPQWDQLLHKAGFRLISFSSVRGPWMIWVAEPIP